MGSNLTTFDAAREAEEFGLLIAGWLRAEGLVAQGQQPDADMAGLLIPLAATLQRAIDETERATRDRVDNEWYDAIGYDQAGVRDKIAKAVEDERRRVALGAER